MDIRKATWRVRITNSGCPDNITHVTSLAENVMTSMVRTCQKKVYLRPSSPLVAWKPSITSNPPIIGLHLTTTTAASKGFAKILTFITAITVAHAFRVCKEKEGPESQEGG